MPKSIHMKKHIRYLLRAEKVANVRFNRINDKTIVLISNGYHHSDLMRVEEYLIRLGCRYDFNREAQSFDKISGKTFVYMKEPK